MTERDALQNVFSTMGQARFIYSGAPREILLIDGDVNVRRTLAKVNLGYWSKSSINFGAQVLFLILQDALPDGVIEAADLIQHGSEQWVIQPGRKSPAETQKAYWQLPVQLGGIDGRGKGSDNNQASGKES